MKRRISLILAAVMIFAAMIPCMSFVCVAAKANTVEVTTADGKTTAYETLDDVAAAGVVADGTTIKLLDDNMCLLPLTLAGNDIVLDGNGFLIQYIGSGYGITVAGGVAYAADDADKTKNLYISGGQSDAAELEVGKITIKNLLILSAAGGIDVCNAVELTLENTSISVPGAFAINMNKFGSTVNLNGGAIIGQANGSAVMRIINNSVLNVYDTYVKIDLPAPNQGRCVHVEKGATVNMYGGVMVSDTYVDCISPRGETDVINMYGGTLLNTYYQPTANPDSPFYKPGTQETNLPECIRTKKTEHINYTSYVFGVIRKGVAVTDSGDFAVKETIKSYDGTKDVYLNYKHTPAHTALGNIEGQHDARIKFSKDGAGIRFTSTVAADLIEYAESIMDLGSEIRYGTIIAPADYVDDWTLNPYLLAAKNRAFKDIPAVDGLEQNLDGSVTFNAALVGIKAANAARDFAAVSYIEYEVNGMTVRNYSLYDGVAQKANLADLAAEYLADVKDSQSGDYLYKTADGKYSPYTADQQKLLAIYAEFAD